MKLRARHLLSAALFYPSTIVVRFSRYTPNSFPEEKNFFQVFILGISRITFSCPDGRSKEDIGERLLLNGLYFRARRVLLVLLLVERVDVPFRLYQAISRREITREVFSRLPCRKKHSRLPIRIYSRRSGATVSGTNRSRVAIKNFFRQPTLGQLSVH